MNSFFVFPNLKNDLERVLLTPDQFSENLCQNPEIVPPVETIMLALKQFIDTPLKNLTP